SAPSKQIAKINSDHCTACGLCVSVCPFGAIELISR
ncbi:MAG: 4Fe-4S binding protein, partial [Bacteroidales bacterium]|nr:4Fe-4S binding protein [Bacteroidales bacterium]